MEKTRPEAERLDVPFPQANSVARISDVVDAIAIGVVARPDIATRLAFDVRHSGYYADAARYLGFVTLDGGYALTKLGQQLVSASSTERSQQLAARMLAGSVFRKAAVSALGGGFPTTREIAEEVRRVRPDLSTSTSERRAQTVAAWLRWALATLPDQRLADRPVRCRTAPASKR